MSTAAAAAAMSLRRSGTAMWLSIIIITTFMLMSSFTSHASSALNVDLSVRVSTPIATTDDNVVCATLDWWPADKCDYGQCPWGRAGILNLDLQNVILKNAIKAFNPLRIRIGGSLQDQVLYDVGNVKKCPHFKKQEGGLFGFSKGCLHMERWDQINDLMNQTGAKLTFGLNALIGKKRPADNSSILWEGDWNQQNAHDFMEYTVSKGYKIDSWELGNELCGEGVSARLEAKQYAKDITELKNLVKKFYPDEETQPPVLGPAGFYNQTWFDTFLEAAGPDVVNGVTHHIYNLGAGVDPNLIHKIQDPYYLSQVAQTFKNAMDSVKSFAPWARAWVGESGGAYNSGGKDVSHTFANSFWYLDQLGMTSTFDHNVYCRQALIGGNYGLLNTTNFVPNPDYYGALLWHLLMGKTVLETYQSTTPYLRAYAHCSKDKAGVTLLLINLSNTTANYVSVAGDMNFGRHLSEVLDGSKREEYRLTPQGGNIQSDILLLNGKPLKLTESFDIPSMEPELVDSSTPIVLEPHSIVYAKLPYFQAPACANIVP